MPMHRMIVLIPDAAVGHVHRMVLVLDGVIERLEYLDDEKRKERRPRQNRTELKERILAAVREHVANTRATFVKLKDLPKDNSIDHVLHYMVHKDKVLRRDKAGVYHLTQQAQEQAA